MDDKEVLQDAEAILDSALSSVHEEDVERLTEALHLGLPSLSRRQVRITVEKTLANMDELAASHGMEHMAFVHAMGPQFLIMVTGFHAGATVQRDLLGKLDPETGEPLLGGEASWLNGN